MADTGPHRVRRLCGEFEPGWIRMRLADESSVGLTVHSLPVARLRGVAYRVVCSTGTRLMAGALVAAAVLLRWLRVAAGNNVV